MGKHRRVHKERLRWSFFRRCIPLYIFLLPACCIVILFQYLPMFSNYMAFLDYDFNQGWFGMASPFVGLANFDFVLKSSFWTMAGRTVLYLSLIHISLPAWCARWCPISTSMAGPAKPIGTGKATSPWTRRTRTAVGS